MKTKKYGGMKRRIMSAALALTMTASMVPAAFANGVPSPLPSNAYLGVTKLEAKAFNLTLEVTPTAVGMQNIYASVIDFGQPGNPTLQTLDSATVKSIDATTYLNPSAITGYPGIIANHRSAMTASTGDDNVAVLNVAALGKTQFTIDESSTSYYHRYALVTFDGGHGGGSEEKYATGYFQVDSKGNSDTWNESYMVRYMKNANLYTGVTGQTVTGMPEYEITKDATAGTRKDTALNATPPTSAGFTFKGWDSNKNLLGSTPNEAAGSTATAKYAAGSTYTPAGVNANDIVNLFAIWQPVKPELTPKTQTNSPAVGKKYEYTFDIGGHNETSKSIAVQAGTLPAGLEIAAVTFSNGRDMPVITGTPTEVKETPTNITLRITDDTNKSYVDVDIVIPPIEPGYQAEPAEDWNTGIEAMGVSAADAVDGKIVGFYAETPGSDAIVYTNMERVYEYRMWKTGSPDFATATDDQKKEDTNWTKWRTLDSTGAMADQSAEPEADRTPGYGMAADVQTPNQATKLLVHDDVNNIDIMNSFAVEGLPKGNYQTRYAEKTTEPKYKASEPTNIAITEGGAGADVDLSNAGVIMYYDWDGTQLGFSVVPGKEATAANIQTVMEEFAKAHSAPAHEDGNANTQDQYGYFNDPTKELTYKAGYQFENKWLYNSSDAFECYLGDGITYPNGTPTLHKLFAAYKAEDVASYADIADKLANDGIRNIAVKAAYKARENLDEGGESSKRYTLANIQYTQVGSSEEFNGTYFLDFDVQRKNQDGNPVTRLREPAIEVQLTPNITGAKPVYNKINLTGGDVTHTQTMVEKTFSSIRYKVFDSYGLSNWTSNDDMSFPKTDFNWKDKVGSDGFVKTAAINRIVQGGRKSVEGDSVEWGNVNQYTFSDAGLMYLGDPITARGNLSKVKSNIISAYTEFIAAGESGFFSLKELQKAIDTGKYEKEVS